MPPTIDFVYTLEDGTPVEASLPGRWKICACCRGDGQIQEPVMFESELQGMEYGTCLACRGSGRVLVVDEARADPRLLLAYAQERWDQDRIRALVPVELFDDET